MKKTIEIWSTYPPPYGGVSIHSLRLYHSLKDNFNIIFKDFNGKNNHSDECIYKIQKPVLEIIKYIFKRDRNIHLHSNRILVWAIMLFYPKSTSIILTLHNQKLRGRLSFFKKQIVNLFLKKVKYILLNDFDFSKELIREYHLDKNKVVIVPAFIAPLSFESDSIPKEINDFMNKHESIISSFAWKLYKVDDKDVYGIDHIIDAFSLLKKDIESVGLILIIPIIEDEKHYKFIIDKINRYNLENCVLIYKRPIRNGFDVWRKSNVFIRATMTDIEGISIKEALYYNVPVVATNVVDRPLGVDTYEYGDIEALYKLLKNSAEKKSLNTKVSDGIVYIKNIYNKLLET